MTIFNSNIECLGFIAILISTTIPFYLFRFGNPLPILVVPIAISVIVSLYLVYYLLPEEKYKAKDNLKVYLLFALGLSLIPYYCVSGAVMSDESIKKYDQNLLNWDKYLFGRLWPLGQWTLSLDKSPLFNPSTILSQTINSVLLIFYMCFFLAVLLVYCSDPFLEIIKEIMYREKNKGKKSENYQKVFNNYYLLYSSLVFTFTQVIFCNTFVPALSPRIFLKDLYKHKLDYLWFMNYLPNNLNNTANSFPSAHVAYPLSLFLTFHALGYYRFKWYIFLYVFMIVLSTLVLRKHYLVDLIIGAIIAIYNFLFCYYFYLKDLENEQREKNKQKTEKDIEKYLGSEDKETKEEESSNTFEENENEELRNLI